MTAWSERDNHKNRQEMSKHLASKLIRSATIYTETTELSPLEWLYPHHNKSNRHWFDFGDQINDGKHHAVIEIQADLHPAALLRPDTIHSRYGFMNMRHAHNEIIIKDIAASLSSALTLAPHDHSLSKHIETVHNALPTRINAESIERLDKALNHIAYVLKGHWAHDDDYLRGDAIIRGTNNISEYNAIALVAHAIYMRDQMSFFGPTQFAKAFGRMEETDKINVANVDACLLYDLSETLHFIDKKGHHPDMPSARFPRKTVGEVVLEDAQKRLTVFIRALSRESFHKHGLYQKTVEHLKHINDLLQALEVATPTRSNNRRK